MIKLAITLFFISINVLANESTCSITSFSKVLKINKVLDDTIIKESSCSSNINSAFVQLISNAQGKLNSGYLNSYFQKEFKFKVSISPISIDIKDLKEVIEEKFSQQKIIIKKISSLYGKSSINLSSTDSFSIDCNKCTKTGERNLKININNKSFWISAKILRERFAYTAKNMINVRASIMQKSDFHQKVVADYGRSNVFTDLHQIQFYSLNRNLHSGDVLKYSDLTAKKLINIGQKVNVFYKGTGINLKTISIAKKNGRFGDFIEVENPKSKKKILGKVIDFNTVVIDI